MFIFLIDTYKSTPLRFSSAECRLKEPGFECCVAVSYLGQIVLQSPVNSAV